MTADNAQWESRARRLRESIEEPPAEAANPNHYISIKQAAVEFELNQYTIRRAIADGRLPASRITGTALIRIRRGDLVRLIDPQGLGGGDFE